MGRWRPPRPDASPYITPDGFAALQTELDGLWLRRRGVVSALAAAAAEGDRSENAEYIYRKKELGGIDYRIRYLQKRLPALNIVREQPNADAVFFGAYVTVEDDTGEMIRYRLVGPDEADPKRNAISLDSPLAQALLKKRIGDEVKVTTDERRTAFTVMTISYTNSDD